MFAGDTNRAAIFYLNQGSEAFLKACRSARAGHSLSMAASSEFKYNDGESSRADKKLATEKTFFVILSLDEAESLATQVPAQRVLLFFASVCSCIHWMVSHSPQNRLCRQPLEMHPHLHLYPNLSLLHR